MTGMVYKWKDRAVLPIEAQVAGEELERIRVSRNGRLTQDDVVAEARAESSPLHPAFEWNDETAAHKYRLEQAGYMIRSIVVTVDKSETEQVPIRAFVNVEREKDRSYTSLAHAMSDAELRAQVVAKAWAELEAWRKRYAELNEFAKLFMVVDRQLAKRAS